MWKKLIGIFNRLKIGFALGMKSADEQLIHNDNVADDINSGIHQQQSDHRVAHHLLKGEVTQEVQELTWRTIMVERESKNHEYYSPYKTVKKQNKSDSRKLKIYNEEAYQILTVQENKAIGDNVIQALQKVDANNISTNENGEVVQNIGRLEKNHNYTLRLERNGMFTPRYYIEEYTKKLVCLVVNEDKNNYILDFYVTKYPNDREWKSKGFVREVEYIKSGRRSDVTDLKALEFITSHAHNFNDGITFKFNKLQFKNVIEYDGDYILRFSAEVVINGKDFFDEDQCESMKKKYEENAPKETTINVNPYDLQDIRVYRCSICGKEVFYNQRDIDALASSEESTGDWVTEYMDMETSEQTFGKMICKECLEKHKAELMEELIKKNI